MARRNQAPSHPSWGSSMTPLPTGPLLLLTVITDWSTSIALAEVYHPFWLSVAFTVIFQRTAAVCEKVFYTWKVLKGIKSVKLSLVA